MKTVHLQDVGTVPAMVAKQVSQGDIIMFNFGIIGKVAKVKHGKMVEITYQNEEGKQWTMRKRPTTLIAVPYK